VVGDTHCGNQVADTQQGVAWEPESQLVTRLAGAIPALRTDGNGPVVNSPAKADANCGLSAS